MQSKLRAKGGFAILLIVLLIAAGLLFASVVFKNMNWGNNSAAVGPKTTGVSAVAGLSKTDSVSDIDSDLANTSFDDIDKDLSQASVDLSSN